jgi:hypothetical protein
MKKLLTILYVIVISNTYAQSPQGINYQSIIRNSAGTVLPSTAVLIEFKLYNSLSGPLVYLENHNITTNSFGMANVIIGQGTAITGSFNTINWANGIAYEVYINSNLVGTKQLFMSVPYALFSPLQPLNLSGNILSSGPTSNSVTLTSGTTYTNGAGISILSGSIITNTAPNQTVILTPGNSNITIGGAYPSYSVSSTSTLSLAGTSLSISNGNTVILPNPGVSTSITPSAIPNNNILITGISPSYTIGAPSYSISNPTGNNLVINNGINSSTLNFNPTLLGDVNGSINSNTVVGIQGKPISTIIPSVGQVLLYTGSIWTPTTLTTATTTIIPGNNIILNQIGTTYTVSSPSYSITNPGSTNNLVINNGINSSTVAIPSQPLSLLGGTLSVGSNTINLSNPTNGFWSVKGNSGISNPTNFIGTTDAADFALRTNNTERMVINSSGYIGVGTLSPSSLLDAVITTTLTNPNPTISGKNLYATSSVNSHGVFGQTVNTNLLAAGVKGESSGFGPSIFGIKQGTATGNSGRFENINSGNAADAIFVNTNGIGAAIHAVNTNTASNSGLFDGNVRINGKTTINDGTQAIGKVLTSDAVGNGSWQALIPAKIAFLAGNNSVGDQIIPAGSVTDVDLTFAGSRIFNDGGGYIPSSGKFVAPITGVYQFNTHLLIGGPSGAVVQVFFRDAAGFILQARSAISVSGEINFDLPVTVKLNGGSPVWIQIVCSSATIYVKRYESTFSGHLIY